MTTQLPQASGTFGEKPVLTFPDTPAPTDLQITILEEGTGALVAAGDSLAANYLGQVWGGQIFDNSYDRGAPTTFPIGVGRVIAGWDKTLVGLKIGTRALVSIPPADGYGEHGNPRAGIKGTDTLVFVVDIVRTN